MTGAHVFVLSGSSDRLLTGTPEAGSAGSPPAPGAALRALGYAGALVRSLMGPRVPGEEPLSLDTPHLTALGFHGNPSELLCADSGVRQNPPGSGAVFRTRAPCPFRIPRPLAAQLANQSAAVVQVLLALDGPAGFAEADPPISTAVVAMEISTPQGWPIPLRDLPPEQAIRLALPSPRPALLGGGGGGGGGGGSNTSGDPSWMSVFTLPAGGGVNFTVQAVHGLKEKAGLYLSLNLSLVPGT